MPIDWLEEIREGIVFFRRSAINFKRTFTSVFSKDNGLQFRIKPFIFVPKQPPEVFYKKDDLKNFKIFPGKPVFDSLFR